MDLKSKSLALDNVIQILELFESKEKLGRLGFNTLIVLRSDSYNILKNKSLVENPAVVPHFQNDKCCYIIGNTNLKTVIKNRIHMANKIIKLSAPEHHQFVNLSDLLLPLVRLARTMFQNAPIQTKMGKFIEQLLVERPRPSNVRRFLRRNEPRQHNTIDALSRKGDRNI